MSSERSAFVSHCSSLRLNVQRLTFGVLVLGFEPIRLGRESDVKVRLSVLDIDWVNITPFKVATTRCPIVLSLGTIIVFDSVWCGLESS